MDGSRPVPPRPRRLRSYVPWWAKIPAKMALARVPISKSTWQRLGIFNYGPMKHLQYGQGVFMHHFARYLQCGHRRSDFTALEVGPGTSLFSALLAFGHGAGRTYLVDVGRYATAPLEDYLEAIQTLTTGGLRGPRPPGTGFTKVEDIVSACRAEYLTEGPLSLRAIPDSSVDFIWSQAVLEHIRLHELRPTLEELHRVMADDGLASHTVDLKDHLSEGLNNLRFSRHTWESALMVDSGFYTNRVRYTEFIATLESAGFNVTVSDVYAWRRLPQPRHTLSPEFRNMTIDELSIASFDVVLTKR